MAADLKVITGANMFCDEDPDESNHLRLDEVGLADITRIMEEHRPGGGFMALEIDMNMIEALTIPFTMKGVAESMMARVGYGDDVIHTYTIFKEIRDVKTNGKERLTCVARGQIASVAHDAYNKRGMAGANFEIKGIQAYLLQIGDRVIYDLDFMTNRRVVLGKDQNQLSNAILGIS